MRGGAVVLLLVAMATSAGAETIKLTTQEWQPYQMVVNGHVTGTAVTAVECVLERMGHKADITVLPWARAQKDVANGVASGFFAASRSVDRDVFAEMSQPFIPQTWRWYFPVGTKVDVDRTETKTGALAGSGMEKWLSDNGYVDTRKLSSPLALLKMLQRGRIEVALSNEAVFRETLARAGAAESAFESLPHSDRPLGVYFGKDFLASHPGFLERFDAKIADCRK